MIRFHNFAISEKGEVYGWGLNSFGQLGLGHDKNVDSPQLIPALTKLDIVEMAAGSFHSLALSRDGSVYSFGQGRDGQLGHDAEEEKPVFEPTQIKEFGPHNPVAQISCGSQYSTAITKDGKVFLYFFFFFFF